jgi:DMSO/TMAO reductase YedYZ molybdopterin-dependent catalytic subunit
VTFFDSQRRFGAIPWLLLALLVYAPANAFAQASQAVALQVTGEVRNHLELSIADIAAFQRHTIRVTDEKGVQAEYSGVPVAEVLRKAGAPIDKEMRGPNMAMGLVARAPDGYQVLFALAEFDSAFNDRVILLADRRDGKPLNNHEGPLRIIVPGDKRGARWIRGVTTLEVLRVK